MSGIDDDALKIARYLYDNKIVGSKSITAGELRNKVGLSEEDFDAAEDFLFESRYCDGTMGGDNGQRVLTAEGVRFVKANSAAKSPQGGAQGSEQPTLDVFISHSSADAKVAESLIALLQTALNVPAERIRCTSVEGHRLEAGASVNDQLRREIHEATTFIGLITRASFESTYVLFELGARWGAGRHLIPLLVSGADKDLLREPLKSLNALRCDVPAQVHQLVDDIATALGIKPAGAAAYQKRVDSLVRRAKKGKGDRSGRGEKVTATAARGESVSAATSPPKDDYLDSLVRGIDGDVSFQDRRAKWRSTAEGVATARAEIEKLYKELERLVGLSNEKSASFKVSLTRAGENRIVLSGRDLNLSFLLSCPSAGSLEGSELSVDGYEGADAVGEQSTDERHTFYGAKYEIDLKRDSSVIWRSRGANETLGTHELALNFFSYLLSSIRRKSEKYE